MILQSKLNFSQTLKNGTVFQLAEVGNIC